MSQIEVTIIAVDAILTAGYWLVRLVNALDSTSSHETRNRGTL